MKEEWLMREGEASVRTGGSGLVTAGIVIAVVIATGSYMSFRPDTAPSGEELTALVSPEASVPEPEVPPSEAPVASTSDAPAAQAEAAAAQADPETVPPSVDEVRLEPDGTAVIAGRAEPGSRVSVLVDGVEVATAQADARGDFAAVGFVAPDAEARVLTLAATGNGEAVASVEEIILAPMSPPEPMDTVAIAEPAPAIEPVAPVAGADPAAAAEAVAETAVAEPDPVTAAATPVAEAPAEGAADAAQPQAAVPEGTETPADAQAAEVPAAVSQATGDASAVETAETAAPQSVAVLKSTEEGVTLLQPAAPLVDEIALDTIGYSQTGDVQLSGRASLEAVQVRVYLNNRTVVNLPVDTEGTWRGDLPNVDAGVYTLRVDALNAAGQVTSRVETPFKREEAAVLAAASTGQEGPAKAITVQTGDTLWAIARDRYGEGVLYVKVFEANRTSIRDPDLIYPGQVFDLPVE
jgi:LysM repeat protein